MRLSIIIVTQLLFQLSSSQSCEYTDARTGRKFYLDALQNAKMTYQNDDGDNHFYTFSPCRNEAVECDNAGGGKDTSMVSQTMQNDPSICEVVANWDPKVQPVYSDNNALGVWDFSFANGNDCSDENVDGPRQLELTFICNPNMTADYNVVYAGLCCTQNRNQYQYQYQYGLYILTR